jgi:hypothetical protein
MVDMDAVLNPLLVRLLLLALHILPLETPVMSLHVLEGGIYAGTYRAERGEAGHVFFRPAPEDTELPAFEAERSRRYGHFYTVFVPEKGESLSVGLAEELKELKPLDTARHQKLGGEKASLRIDAEGGVVIVGSEEGPLAIIGEHKGLK